MINYTLLKIWEVFSMLVSSLQSPVPKVSFWSVWSPVWVCLPNGLSAWEGRSHSCVHRAWKRAGSWQMSDDWMNIVDIEGKREYFQSVCCLQGTCLEIFLNNQIPDVNVCSWICLWLTRAEPRKQPWIRSTTNQDFTLQKQYWSAVTLTYKLCSKQIKMYLK